MQSCLTGKADILYNIHIGTVQVCFAEQSPKKGNLSRQFYENDSRRKRRCPDPEAEETVEVLEEAAHVAAVRAPADSEEDRARMVPADSVRAPEDGVIRLRPLRTAFGDIGEDPIMAVAGVWDAHFLSSSGFSCPCWRFV